MNKLFTKIVGVALGLTMAIGVGLTVASNSEAVPAHAAGAGQDVLFAKGFGGYTTNSLSATGTDRTGVANSTNVSGVTYALQVFNGSTGAVRGNQSAGSSNFSARNTTTQTGYYISSVSLTVSGGTIDGSTSGRSVVYFGTSAFSNPDTSAPAGTATIASPSSSGQATLTWTNTNTSCNYFILYHLKTSGTALSANATTSLKVTWASAAKYTVSFNGNGGTGSMSAVTDVSGSYTLPNCGFTAPSNKAFSGWKAGNAGSLLAAGSSYTVSADVTFFAQWADVYTVTYSAGSNGSGSYAHTSQPAGTYTLLPFASLTGVSASSGYRFVNYTVGGVSKDPGDTITLSATTSVTVNFEEQPLETTYDFTTNFSTYASEWSNSYGNHEGLNGETDIGGDYAATIDLFASKQTSTITDRPVFATKTASGSYTQVLKFTLTEIGYKIKQVTVTFAQWSSKTPSIALYKGGSVSGTALDTATIGTKNTLTTSNLNDTVFTVGYSDGNTLSNVQSGLTSIYITLEALAGFGTLDHISVTSMPNVVYHVGETFSFTGFAVTAYDGADETTANFKDVTASVETDLDDPTPFVDGDVPGFDCEVSYSGDGGSDTTSFHVYVYALAEYKLVTSAPTDWSGNYLIVGTNANSDLVAMNGGLTNPDLEANYKVVSADANDVIEAGQELEWTIASYSTGYSIQGKSTKYIGRETADNGMNVSDAALVNTLSISGNNVTIAGSSSSYQLTFSTTGDRFRYYTSGTVQLYKLVVSDNADAFAQTFLGAFTCDATGNSEPTFTIKEGSTYWTWALLATEYDTLTAVEKKQFRLGVASESGDNIAKALARYDYIVAKYGTSKYSNFMSRTITPLSSSGIVLSNVIGNNGTTISLIIVVSLVGLTAIGGYFFIRKRKEQ